MLKNFLQFDLAQVDWTYVGVLTIFVFVSTLVGNLVTFRHRALAPLFSAILFGIIFLLWSYYPHGLSLPIRMYR